MAMLERGLEVGEDVDRSIMSKEVSFVFFLIPYAMQLVGGLIKNMGGQKSKVTYDL